MAGFESLEDEFGDVIGKARQGRGWSVKQTAGESGVEAGRIESFESYEETPSPEEVDQLADVLDLDAEKLADIAFERWLPEAEAAEPQGLDVDTVTMAFGPYSVNAYVIASDGEALVVDSGIDGRPLVTTLERRGLDVTAVIFTHGDEDHVGGFADLPGADEVPVWIHRSDADPLLEPLGERLNVVEDGDTFSAAGIEFEVIHVPGHTPGSAAFAAEDAVFAGDILFAGSLGRTNGTPQDFKVHHRRTRERLLSLPERTVLLPGHGPPTTVGEELEHNPFFKGT